MKKYIHLFTIVLGLAFFSCNEASEAKEQTVDTVQETNATKDSLTTEDKEIEPVEPKEIALINMLPEVDYDYIPDNYIAANVLYYAGEIGTNEVELVLIQDRDAPKQYEGRYIYTSNGSSFPIKALRNDQDSITIERKTKGGIVEVFSGAISSNSLFIEGIWNKGEQSLEFYLEAIVFTPEQTQFFVDNTNDFSVYNTPNGIVSDAHNYPEPDFNSFYVRKMESNGYDFGEEWIYEIKGMYITDTTYLLVNGFINNASETVFEDGHGPSGGEDTDYIVKGMDYSCFVSLSYDVIKNGVRTEHLIEFDRPYNLNAWLFKSYIVFETELKEVDKEAFTMVYKWSSATDKYEKID